MHGRHARVVSRLEKVSRAGADQHASVTELLRALDAESRATRDQGAVTKALLSHVCAYLGWPVGHAWVADATGDRFESTDLWHREPQGEYQELVDASRDSRVGADDGFIGRAVARKQPEWLARGAANFLRAD